MQVARIVALAGKITEDIERRGLQPGDPYQATEKTARMLGVSAAAANRAMQVLVKRGVLHRRQGRGTFIAQTPNGGDSPLDRVRLLVREDVLASEGLLTDGVLVGVQAELPGTDLQINFIPADEGQGGLEELMGEALRAPRSEGFVLIRSTLAAQRVVKASGLPAVVYGTPYPSEREMASVDRDHRQLGELLARHLLERGFRRMLLLLRQHMSPGDHLALDQIYQVFSSAGLGLEDVVIRCLPSDEQVVADEVSSLLRMDPRPTGFFCRNLPLARGVAAALGNTQREAEIVVADVYREANSPAPRFPHARPLLTPEEIGRCLGRLLARQTRETPAGPNTELIPVRLEIPDPSEPAPTD